MSTELRDRLDAVAGRAPVLAPPEDLWRRGRRRQVRRAASSTVAAVVVAMVVGVGGAMVWTALGRDVQPVAPSPAELRLPDRLFTPSPWLQGTDDVGPGGPYVALIGAERARWDSVWRGTGTGLVGVGLDGSYRFLDLPGHIGDGSWGSSAGEVALSPDGRYLAYWRAGQATGEPLVGESGGPVVAGIAVYDSLSGEVLARPLTTEHGVATEGMSWAGPVLRATYGALDRGGVAPDSWGSETIGQLSWDARTARWSEETDLSKVFDVTGTWGPTAFVDEKRQRVVVVGADGALRSSRLSTVLQGGTVPSPGNGTLAGIRGAPGTTDNLDHPIVVADLSGPTADTSRVPDVTANRVLGWRDATQVVVQRSATWPRIEAVDVATGATMTLTRMPVPLQGSGVSVAADAWSAPLMTAVEPDWPMSTTQRQLLVGGGVLVAWAAFALWRRRRGRA